MSEASAEARCHQRMVSTNNEKWNIMKKAEYQYGERVQVRWHEAECGVSDAVIIGIQLQSKFEPPLYEVKTLDKFGNMEPGSITDIDEDMIHPANSLLARQPVTKTTQDS